jgi:hypothetical protein
MRHRARTRLGETVPSTSHDTSAGPVDMSIVNQLMEIGGFGPEGRREIEFELACAVVFAQNNIKRKSINWSGQFPWLKVALRKKQNDRCCWCDGIMRDDGPPRRRPTFEHIVPLSRGGEDAPSNLAIACDGCNQDKGNETGPPTRWRHRASQTP